MAYHGTHSAFADGDERSGLLGHPVIARRTLWKQCFQGFLVDAVKLGLEGFLGDAAFTLKGLSHTAGSSSSSSRQHGTCVLKHTDNRT